MRDAQMTVWCDLPQTLQQFCTFSKLSLLRASLSGIPISCCTLRTGLLQKMYAMWKENDAPKCSLNKTNYSLQIQVIKNCISCTISRDYRGFRQRSRAISAFYSLIIPTVYQVSLTIVYTVKKYRNFDGYKKKTVKLLQ